MTIETKLNLGDKVFILHENKVHEVEVIGVSTTTLRLISKNLLPEIVYDISGIENSNPTRSYEEFLFKTKQELLDSL